MSILKDIYGTPERNMEAMKEPLPVPVPLATLQRLAALLERVVEAPWTDDDDAEMAALRAALAGLVGP